MLSVSHADLLNYEDFTLTIPLHEGDDQLAYIVACKCINTLTLQLVADMSRSFAWTTQLYHLPSQP